MSPSAPLTLEQLKEIIKNEMKRGKGAREDQEQVEDGEEVLNPDNSSTVMKTIRNISNNKHEHQCLDEAVNVLNARQSHQLQADKVPVNMP